jgi:hypothetical protein
MAMFSRWYYGPVVGNPAGAALAGTYQTPVVLYATSGGCYVGLGNSVVVQVSMTFPAPTVDTDVIGADIELLYKPLPSSLSDARRANTGDTTWTSAGPISTDYVVQPHPFWHNTNLLVAKYRIWRMLSPLAEGSPANPPGGVSAFDFVIRDIATDDNLVVRAFLIPRSCVANTDAWTIPAAALENAYHIHCRICYGGHARSH